MLATSTDFQNAIAGTEYFGAWRVQITLPAAGSAYNDVTLAVQRVSIDVSTSSDMPEGTRIESGLPAAECTFTVSGLVDQTDASKTAAWLFGPYSSTSPLYHTDVLFSAVTVDFGLYTLVSAGTPEYVRKFTGIIDDYTCSEDGSVTFTCIDSVRSKLRSVPALPAIVDFDPMAGNLTSEFAIDALLRAATGQAISSWPARRTGCVVAAGLHTTAYADFGTTNFVASDVSYSRGAFGAAISTATGVQFLPTSNITGDDARVEFWITKAASSGVVITVGNTAANATDNWTVSFATSSRIDVTLTAQGGAATVTKQFTFSAFGTSSHYVAVQVHWPQASTSYSVTVNVDQQTPQTQSGTLGTARSTVYGMAWVSPTAPAAVEAFQLTTETNTATSNATFSPTAVLDPSLNTLIVIPSIDGDPWAAIQQIADAELGVAGGDESGVFRFYNRNTLRAPSSVRDVTSAASLAGVGDIDTSTAGVVNHAVVEYTPWSVASSHTTVWSAKNPIKVPKSSTKVIKVTTETPFTDIDTTLTLIPDGQGTTAVSGTRMSVDRAGTSENHSPGTIAITQTSSNTANLTVFSAAEAWFVSPANYLDVTAGTPLLRISAKAVTQGDTASMEFQYPPSAASTRFGDVVALITGNPWIQDDDGALQMATDIVIDQCVPRPNLTGVAIVPDPRLQLADVAHIVDPDRTGVDEYARIFGWTITWEAGSGPLDPMTYGMTIDARTLAAPGGWLMGVAGRSEVGSTTYVYSGA